MGSSGILEVPVLGFHTSFIEADGVWRDGAANGRRERRDVRRPPDLLPYLVAGGGDEHLGHVACGEEKSRARLGRWWDRLGKKEGLLRKGEGLIRKGGGPD